MNGIFLKGVLLGSLCSTAVLLASSALAGSGVGAVFNLGVSNTVSGATTDLSGTNAGPQLRVDNAGTGNAIVGRLTNTAPAVHTAGILGNNLATNGFGFGLWGSHQSGGVGVLGSTVSGIGVRGTHNATTGSLAGVEGFTNSSDGAGGRFENEAAGVGSAGVGLIALGRDHNDADNDLGGDGFSGGIEASGPNGVEGNSHTPGGYGVSGDGPAVGVRGAATAADGAGGRFTGGEQGVVATGTASGVDASVSAVSAVGVRSSAGASANDAIRATTASPSGNGLEAVTTGGTAWGVFSAPTGGGIGVGSTPGFATAFFGSNSSPANATVSAINATGIAGRFTGRFGLIVETNGNGGRGLDATFSGDDDGNGNVADDANQPIFASTDDTNIPAVITAITPAGSDVEAHEAIETSGFVDVNGSARVTGTLTKGAGAFEIDHPLDPANRYLRHSFVESPDMMNVYNGTTRTDAEGFAKVVLPAYFPALNRDFRYQLTVLGRSFAQAIVWDELAKGGRTFTIRSSEPGVKVSWQVTGIRRDAYAKAHPIVVEETKTGAARGAYLHPELFGRPDATPLGLDAGSPTGRFAAAQDKAAADLQALGARKRAEALADARRDPDALPAQAQQR